MTTIAPDTLISRLKWRSATKKFDPTKKISTSDWRALEETLVLSPSSFGLQPWKFIVVDNPDLRTQLRAHAWNQSQITDASHLVVLAVKKNLSKADVARFVDRIAAVRKIERASLSEYENMMLGFIGKKDQGFDVTVWATRQVYIALGFFLSAAANLGIDACPMEGFDPAQFDKLLGLDQQGFGAVVLATAGYRSEDDPYSKSAKVRFDAKEIIQHV